MQRLVLHCTIKCDCGEKVQLVDGSSGNRPYFPLWTRLAKLAQAAHIPHRSRSEMTKLANWTAEEERAVVNVWEKAMRALPDAGIEFFIT